MLLVSTPKLKDGVAEKAIVGWPGLNCVAGAAAALFGVPNTLPELPFNAALAAKLNPPLLAAAAVDGFVAVG